MLLNWYLFIVELVYINVYLWKTVLNLIGYDCCFIAEAMK